MLTPARFAGLALVTFLGCSSPPPATPSPSPADAGSSASASPESSAAPAASTTAAAPDAGAAAGPTTAKPAPADTALSTDSARTKLMKEHFKDAALLRAAVINGALPDTIAPARALSEMEGFGNLPAQWKPSFDALQAASKRVGQSPDIPAAAAATADIGAACGSCHRVAGGPKVKVEAAPAPVDKSLHARMQRHVWATERLWETLYAPSDASWKAGVDALAGDPFPKDLLDKGGVHARSAAAKFTSISATAGTKTKPEERAKVYASLLETCSQCHLATRDKTK